MSVLERVDVTHVGYVFEESNRIGYILDWFDAHLGRRRYLAVEPG